MPNAKSLEARIAKIATTQLIADITALSANLKDSRLVASVDSTVKTTGADTFVSVVANDYYKFIDSGRRAGATPPPYAAILDWILRKKIGRGDISPNRLAWAIRAAIAKNGIRPRPYLKTYQKNLEAELEKTFANALELTLIDNFKKMKK